MGHLSRYEIRPYKSSDDDDTQWQRLEAYVPAALISAKLPRVRFHDLRHSCASLLLALGVPAKLVQETLGHSSYQLTMDTYSHMIPALRNEVADKMDGFFSTTVNEAVTPAKPPVN